jgi:hypothetical protein
MWTRCVVAVAVVVVVVVVATSRLMPYVTKSAEREEVRRKRRGEKVRFPFHVVVLRSVVQLILSTPPPPPPPPPPPFSFPSSSPHFI